MDRDRRTACVFRFPPGVSAPLAHKNIFKEIEKETRCARAISSCLEKWAGGVLLLNVR
jgi:uracil DNA glycosylase